MIGYTVGYKKSRATLYDYKESPVMHHFGIESGSLEETLDNAHTKLVRSEEWRCFLDFLCNFEGSRRKLLRYVEV